MAFGFLRRAGVIHHMIFQVLRQTLSGIQPFFESSMGNIPRHDDRTRERQSGGHWVLAQFRQNFRHRPIQIDFDHRPVQVMFSHLWKVLGRIGFELLQKDTILRDLA